MKQLKPPKHKIARFSGCLKEEQKKSDIAKSVLNGLGYELCGSKLKKGGKVVGRFHGFDENDFPIIKLFKKPKVKKPTPQPPRTVELGVVDMHECYILFPKGEINPKWVKIWNFGNYIEY